jgi:hypothetical protein
MPLPLMSNTENSQAHCLTNIQLLFIFLSCFSHYWTLIVIEVKMTGCYRTDWQQIKLYIEVISSHSCKFINLLSPLLFVDNVYENCNTVLQWWIKNHGILVCLNMHDIKKKKVYNLLWEFLYHMCRSIFFVYCIVCCCIHVAMF